MYFPYLTKRTPSNRECRIASIVGAVGFAGFAWLLLAMPASLVSMLTWLLAIELFLGYLGIGTLYIAKPNHFSPWPFAGLQTVRGQEAPPLDERDLNIRYRTYLASYRILSLTAFAYIAFGRLAATVLIDGSRDHVAHWRLQATDLLFLAVIYFLSLFLPYLVFPWLEPATPLDDEDMPASDCQPLKGSLGLQRHWRLVSNAVVWLIIFLLILRLYNRYVHGY